MKRAEVWRGDDREWCFLTTHCRPRHLRRLERIAASAWPEDHTEGHRGALPHPCRRSRARPGRGRPHPEGEPMRSAERRLWLIYRAWTNPGPVRDYQRNMKNRVRRQMPVLARLLDDMYWNPPKEPRR